MNMSRKDLALPPGRVVPLSSSATPMASFSELSRAVIYPSRHAESNNMSSEIVQPALLLPRKKQFARRTSTSNREVSKTKTQPMREQLGSHRNLKADEMKGFGLPTPPQENLGKDDEFSSMTNDGRNWVTSHGKQNESHSSLETVTQPSSPNQGGYFQNGQRALTAYQQEEFIFSDDSGSNDADSLVGNIITTVKPSLLNRHAGGVSKSEKDSRKSYVSTNKYRAAEPSFSSPSSTGVSVKRSADGQIKSIRPFDGPGDSSPIAKNESKRSQLLKSFLPAGEQNQIRSERAGSNRAQSRTVKTDPSTKKSSHQLSAVLVARNSRDTTKFHRSFLNHSISQRQNSIVTTKNSSLSSFSLADHSTIQSLPSKPRSTKSHKAKRPIGVHFEDSESDFAPSQNSRFSTKFESNSSVPTLSNSRNRFRSSRSHSSESFPPPDLHPQPSSSGLTAPPTTTKAAKPSKFTIEPEKQVAARRSTKRNPPHQPLILSTESSTSSPWLFLQRELGTRIRGEMAQNSMEEASYSALLVTQKFSGASGDVSVVDFTPDGSRFVAGAVANMDENNIQYNKKNNLLVGDCGLNIMIEVPDHVYGGIRQHEGSAEAPVVPLHTTITDVKFALEGSTMYSSSYDWTVKKFDMDGGDGWKQGDGLVAPKCVDEFWHEGPVDVMALSCDDHGLLATGQSPAYENPEHLISLFDLDENLEDNQPHSVTYLSVEKPFRDYQPTVMKWGLSQETDRLLVAGFSAKQDSKDSSPPNAGLLCLWNISESSANQISLKRSSNNVFDAVWHPNQPWLAVGSRPRPYDRNHSTRSVVRVYNNPSKSNEVMEYDCPANDMNMVTFRGDHDHISASCTDGSTYVWDYRMSNLPLHKLSHGKSMNFDNPAFDTGVQLALWGEGHKFLYTGSSDGVLKEWDISRAREDVFIRNVAEFDAEIMCGKFSSDFSRLLIGDARGSIHVLSAGQSSLSFDSDVDCTDMLLVGATEVNPKTLHVPSQSANDANIGKQHAKDLLQSGIIVMHPIFGAGKGPKYDGPYAKYAHVDNDPLGPLLDQFKATQLDDQQTGGLQALLDDEGRHRRDANLGLAAVRNGGIVESLLAGQKKSQQLDNSVMDRTTIVDLEDEDDVVKVEVVDGMVLDPGTPEGWIEPPPYRGSAPKIIDLTGDSE